MSRAKRQIKIFDWVIRCFGPTSPQERLKRLLEEAVELAQSEDISKSEAQQIVEYVYSRPKGDPEQEVGGLCVCILAYCELKGYLASVLEKRECRRVLKKDPEHFRERHNKKAEAGIALPVAIPSEE